MNALQTFIQSKPYGFITDKDLPELIKLDRLCPLLVRLGCGRFTCAAQDVAHMLECVEAGGDYVRDISFPVGSFERAATWRPEPAYVDAWTREAKQPPKRQRESFNEPDELDGYQNDFNESDCGGAFDGNQVISDCDPGL